MTNTKNTNSPNHKIKPLNFSNRTSKSKDNPKNDTKENSIEQKQVCVSDVLIEQIQGKGF